MPNYDLKQHSHGAVSSDGKIGTASGKIVTTGTGGALQASNSITKSQISDFPTTMTPSSHNHTVSDISDCTTMAVTITYTDDTTETKNLVVYTPSS